MEVIIPHLSVPGHLHSAFSRRMMSTGSTPGTQIGIPTTKLYSTTSKKTQPWLFRKGDYVIYTNQKSNRYIIETLEPQAPDAYFAWNFFDGILMQKEYFSSYVFEDLAAEYLKQNPELQEQLEKKKKEDEKFASSARAQLNFIYQNSPWHEKTHRVYPVGRLIQKIDLPVE